MTDSQHEVPSRETTPKQANDEKLVSLGQVVFLRVAQSGGRQRMLPALFSLLMALVLGVDRLLGGAIPDVAVRVIALPLGLWAAWRAWRIFQDTRVNETWRWLLIVPGGLLALEGLLIVLGVELLPPFVLMLGLFAIGELVVNATRLE